MRVALVALASCGWVVAKGTPDAVVPPDAATTVVDAVDADLRVFGSGTESDPYRGAGESSCAEFLAVHPAQDGLDGIYEILYGFDPVSVLYAYCDMTTDGGGWTLVARVDATSLAHATAWYVGTLTSPTQTDTGKVADETINVLHFSHVRLQIENVGTIYVKATSIDLSGATEFTTPNVAAPAPTGPYSYTFLTQTSCSSGCGVDVIRPSFGFGNNCGYQYWANASTPKPGMGCQGNFGKSGTVWVQ